MSENPVLKKVNAEKENQLPLFSRVSLQEKIDFSRHLSIIIKSGLPMFEGLKIVQAQTKSRGLRRITNQLIEDINNGQALAKSFKKFKSIFGDFFISIVEVGEASGTLAENLLYLSDEMKKAKSLRGKVKSAMIYPGILFVMTIIVNAFLAFFIFPKLITAFENLNIKLPVTTRILISVLGFVREYFFILVGGAVAFIVLFRLLLKIEKVRYAIDRVILLLPVFSKFTIDVGTANFTRVLGVLLKGGIKIVEAITITSNTADNLVYRKRLLDAAEGIRQGNPLAKMLGGNQKMFPPILTGMIEIGETTGNLEENLTYLSEYFTEETDNSLKNLTAFIEPLILVIMGLIVGFVAISIVVPIYSISQGISR
ncbi:MAG: type II secretion system F family protein [Patescibacteria group bacterium]